MIGIYKIENKINGFVYIGQSTNIEKRFLTHRRELKANTHCNIHLQRAWNKYGCDSFCFSVIEQCKSREELNDKETFWLKHYMPNVYNLGATGNVGTMSEERKQKLSEALKGRKVPLEVRMKMSLALKGRKGRIKTKEEIENHRQKLKGRHLSRETEFKKGHKMSQEIREKISRTEKNRYFSEEHKRKISQAKMGHMVSLETRMKISKKLKGRKYKVKERKLGEFNELVAQFIKESEKVAGKGENE